MENAQKIGAAGDSNPRPRGIVVFRAALVTARTDGKSLTWVGKEGIHSETVNVCTRVRVVFLCFALKFWRVGNVCLHCHMVLVRVALGLGFKGNKFAC